MSKILCIGEALIDMICTDKGRSLSEGENFLKNQVGRPPMWPRRLRPWADR